MTEQVEVTRPIEAEPLLSDTPTLEGESGEPWDCCAEPQRFALLYLPLPGDDYSGEMSELYARGWFEHDLVKWLDVLVVAGAANKEARANFEGLAYDLQAMSRAAWQALSTKRTVRVERADDGAAALEDLARFLLAAPRLADEDSPALACYRALGWELLRRTEALARARCSRPIAPLR